MNLLKFNTYLKLDEIEINTPCDLDKFFGETHSKPYIIEILECSPNGTTNNTYKGQLIARNKTRGILLFDIEEFIDGTQSETQHRNSDFMLAILTKSPRQISLGYWQ